MNIQSGKIAAWGCVSCGAKHTLIRMSMFVDKGWNPSPAGLPTTVEIGPWCLTCWHKPDNHSREIMAASV